MNAREPNFTESRSARLRRMLVSSDLEFLMEAHNGLSARIVREAGFKGIWGSGLSISAQFGVRDNNEASWTQVVDVLEFMADASDLPILLDGDTGYGNFNNVRRLVRKLEQRGIAGVCIEDKQFPKTNSFIDGERQPLAEIDEFCGKIKAGKDSQTDPDFSIVARVEALIAGWGMDEALRRANAYADAGADAILIHSKLSRPDEILEFAREWNGRAPLVIVPTKYYSTPTDVFRQAGISTVIWANHLIRAAARPRCRPPRATSTRTQTLVNVEDRVATVNEIFRLQDADEYSAAERIYLSSSSRASNSAIVLAASRGKGLEAVTEDKPKVMLPVAGKPLLRWLVDGFKKEGVNDITVVGGYRADAIDTAGIKLVVNERHAETGELSSLACALERLKGDTVISYGDLLFRSYIVRDLAESEAEFSVVVDSSLTDSPNQSVRDFALCSAADDRGLFGQKITLQRVAGDAGNGAPHGRWIGLLNVRGAGVERLKAMLATLQARPDFDTLDIPALLNALIAAGEKIEVQYVHGHWRGVNDLEDFRRAGDFAHGQTPLANGARRRGRAMIEAAQFVEAARERGFDWYAGVPCSYLTPFINYVLQDPTLHYVSAANEGDAVALIAGATLGGQARHRDDAELGPRQRGEPAHLADLDLPPAAAADRHVARPAGRVRRAAARADGPDHAADARHDGNPVGAVPDRGRPDRPGAGPRDPPHGRDGPPLRARDAKRQRGPVSAQGCRPMPAPRAQAATPVSARAAAAEQPTRQQALAARDRAHACSTRPWCWPRPVSAAASSTRSTIARTSCTWSARWAA